MDRWAKAAGKFKEKQQATTGGVGATATTVKVSWSVCLSVLSGWLAGCSSVCLSVYLSILIEHAAASLSNNEK
jgi:hypothetical protein